ncbi:MAG: hypothetical protein EOP56_17205 [Sphingobacteriales bacterium]|nr:MAG: hypothetical protein EOP56_17205 [Sphingobacteriales bacterium]
MKYVCIAVLLLWSSLHGYAQSLATRNAGLRYEVNAKRTGTNIQSDDALPRSREFKRIDSSYYVGWMYEGVYKFNHAADYLGFKNASIPLEHALYQMERDYRKELATRTSDLMQYFPAYNYHLDYTQTAYYLVQCYSNTEEAEKMYTLLRRVLKWNFQRDYYLDTYNYLFWVTHRNRYYNNSKYSFLRNSIDENEQLANKYLDSQLRRIERNKVVNQGIFQPGYERDEKYGVYHYKSIYYSYRLNIDSAAYYYNLLRNTVFFPHNNYATFRAICGDFKEAELEYQMEAAQDRGDKRLKEWAYYTSIINLYKAEPKMAAELLKDMIRSGGSTPGFGWYNIALARAMYYDGQIGESNRYLNKAAEFKELHIGTTLTQTHYDFSLQLVKLMNKQSQFERQKFEHRNWWYNPKVLGTMAGYRGEQYMQQFLIINQFAQNPERDRVIYKLFATESTVSWDEVWYLMKDFSTRFFLDRFQKELQTDERKYIRKYFQLFVARLQMKQGNYKEARRMLDAILMDPNIDKEYEKLLLARVYQAQAECAEERKDKDAYNQWVYRAYITYPQLLPNTGLAMNMRLHVSGQSSEDIVQRLKDCNINWMSGGGAPAVDAYVNFLPGTGTKKRIEYYVVDPLTNTIVEKQSFAYSKPELAGVQLAYKLFGVGGKPPAADTDAERTTL